MTTETRMSDPIRGRVDMTDYVLCPVTITSPAPSEAAQALGLTPNMVCGARCPVLVEAPVMAFICPLGHEFVARPGDVSRNAA